ncbi:hypothetical protein [Lignipirellula cremea]|uniref:hypothetical protein n=1 Tax=Lignipirellula cremea TaxID=2528010 RepID=UPI0011A61DE6|nr:hypothetical protein [Lignipirellula cremea]
MLDWQVWTTYLRQRPAVAGLAEITVGNRSPLLWRLPSDMDETSLAALPALRSRAVSTDDGLSAVNVWLERIDQEPLSADLALEALAWAWSAPDLADRLPEDAWRRLVNRLTRLALDSGAVPLLESPVVHQWIQGELPLVLWHLLPELASSAGLFEPASAALSAGLLELLDGEGVPAARYWNQMGPLLACWTRAAWLAGQHKDDVFSGDGRTHYEWLVRQSLRASRGDGRQSLTTGTEGQFEPALLALAVKLSGDPDDCEISAAVLPRGGLKEAPAGALPEPADHSEWAGVALLRSNWSRKSRGFTALYSALPMQAELWVGKRALIHGQWSCTVARNGQTLAVKDDAWREVCWHSDDDVQYLELELELAERCRVQRQILLAPEDGILLLADAVLSDEPGQLEYATTLPLATGIACEPQRETYEGTLADDKRLGVMLPLALPEWKSEASPGNWEQTEAGLNYQLRGSGPALYAPLFFDLKPNRSRKQLTWRRLTVAEKLSIVSPEVAAGYRVRIGDEQWVVYRSLTGVVNRTLMGQNVFCEFAALRFDTDGDTEELISLE